MSDFNPDDKDGYQTPSALINNNSDSPFNTKKIPIDENHTCPMCLGKGYIGIVYGKSAIGLIPRKKRGIL